MSDSSPITEVELAALREQSRLRPLMQSACEEYGCPCHAAMGRVLDELDRLRAEVKRLGGTP